MLVVFLSWQVTPLVCSAASGHNAGQVHHVSDSSLQLDRVLLQSGCDGRDTNLRSWLGDGSGQVGCSLYALECSQEQGYTSPWGGAAWTHACFEEWGHRISVLCAEGPAPSAAGMYTKVHVGCTLWSHQWHAAGAPEEDASAALAERLLQPIRELPSTDQLLADALCAKPLCRIPVDQAILDSLSATGRPDLKAMFTLRDHSCDIIATAFSYVMRTSFGAVSSLHCCISHINQLLTSLLGCCHCQPAL